MKTYEELQEIARQQGVDVIDNYTFTSERIDGLYCDSTVAISKKLETDVEKACVLAEELGHHNTACGDITEQSNPSNRKQELHGRIIAYNNMVGLMGLISAYNNHCQNICETADFLGVTEKFLMESINYYKNKYGTCATVDNYIIFFDPAIAVLELI